MDRAEGVARDATLNFIARLDEILDGHISGKISDQEARIRLDVLREETTAWREYLDADSGT